MYWAAKSGVEVAQEFGMSPGKPSRHYRRHLDAVMKTHKLDNQYTLPVPGHSKHDACRTVHQVPTRVPHECVEEELQEDPGLLEKTQ
eukprot:14417314-Alexandrium_andersonii.AAC.1